ncbi:ABC transporter substrate-binding protein [Schaalia hyovaginalis]|uniref:ABC transporter substrate-binding protein n=3 Tax=Schaalia hyovaginalis TaxID=29316 RepID=UPI0026F34327|nr:extracellular solute-binding protein [Schaalia hyovaginalis]MDY2669863.1 extracellular solute-binding protein [Schaalia hyovaginalis]MDY4492515.1 extracellular solute-binding protein [Schaalia hyovaginalis]
MSVSRRMIATGALVPLCLMMAACGSGTPPADQSAGGGGSSLTVWAWDPAFNIYALREAEKIYQKDHPDFTLNIVETPWDDLQPKLTTIAQAAQSDQLPDIFLMQNYSFQKNVVNYPDIFSTFDADALDFTQFPESVVASSTVDGAHYGLPFDSGTAIHALRTDVLEQAGYTISDFTDITWDEYIDKGKDVLAKTGKPLMSTMAGNSDLVMMMLQSAGRGLFNKEGEPDIAKNDALLEVARVYKELIESGVLLIVNSWDEYIGSFVNGSVAGTINGVWIAASIQTAEDQSGKWAVTNVPSLSKIDGATNYTANGGSSWAISANADKALAQDFLASTFGGSVELYDTILPKAGAIANWIPAGQSSVYSQPQDFFGGQKVYSEVVAYGAKVPTVRTGVYHTEARDAVNTALTQIASGQDAATALATAQETVEFAMK